MNTLVYNSYVKMSSEEVARLAQDTLSWVKEEREKARARWMERCCTQLTKSLGAWWRLWWKRVPTEEEVECEFRRRSVLDGHVFQDSWADEVAKLCLSQERVATCLLLACKHSSEMYVSAYDLAHIDSD